MEHSRPSGSRDIAGFRKTAFGLFSYLISGHQSLLLGDQPGLLLGDGGQPSLLPDNGGKPGLLPRDGGQLGPLPGDGLLDAK